MLPGSRRKAMYSRALRYHISEHMGSTNGLTTQEIMILNLTYGICGPEYTNEQICDLLWISVEAVQNIRRNAMQKIERRHPYFDQQMRALS